MTRLEAGKLAPNAAPTDLGEVVGSALQRASKILAGHRVEVDVSADLPLLALDPVLLEQALFNLLDNAAKYAPPASTITLRGWRDGGAVRLRILDEGEGIPADEVGRIFEKFHRARKGDRQRAGTGLGLSICRGFVEAMGGTIAAANRADRPGAAFTITFPVPASATRLEAAE
jgi:two-component system sensor histidine kinase KdpD